ncbi:hypothetical protein CC77DRAFT_1091300 [Alternaria alternata]|uniref:G domain-containing protein n=1 Tax=Alternaria alternata TaxID=5599 RepID=A0A177DXY8_ALTAL|nr:hypothetical protein CC77DRAFT_1091300 [Alternaria alternata]OAG24348.1 hypothetical protein CC77DRAFT_1091300 [Alternaria alternata]
MSSHPLIAVIGVNGAGKSTFINVASGRNDLGVGHGIEACTQDITPKSVLVDNAWVNLIDTPGWDDTYRTDTDILTLIGDYVGRMFSAGQLLQGVILLQLVDGTRVYGTERRRNRLYERICGMDAYRNIVVATTMWSTVVDQAAADQRVQQRIESPEFWDSMVQGGPFATSPPPSAPNRAYIKAMILRDTSRITELEEELRRTAADNAAMRARLEGDLNDLIEKLKKAEDDIERLKQRRRCVIL